MQFNEIYIGTTFKFCSDTENWWYEKIDDNKVICVESPFDNRYIGEKHIINEVYYNEVEIRTQKKESNMNLQQIEAKIQELRANLIRTNKVLSAVVNHRNYKISLSNSSDYIPIDYLFDEETWKVFEQRAHNEHKAAERAIEEFTKKFA